MADRVSELKEEIVSIERNIAEVDREYKETKHTLNIILISAKKELERIKAS